MPHTPIWIVIYLTEYFRANFTSSFNMVFLVISILYFFLYSKNRLVAQAPEEEMALIAKAEKELHHQ